ncbi:MAG TPA: thermonuclease family protein [Allosphingosinicella sp.]
MSRLRKYGTWALLIGLVAAWAWMQWRDSHREKAGKTIATRSGTGIRVIDGDSMRIGNTTVRIAGIDAPEYRQTCRDAANAEWPCGHEARAALQRLIAAPGFACIERARDRYRRRLSDCRTNDGDVGAAMVRQGLADDARDPRFQRFAAELAEARRAHRGIWRGPHDHPADWRTAHPRRPRAATRVVSGEEAPAGE